MCSSYFPRCSLLEKSLRKIVVEMEPRRKSYWKNSPLYTKNAKSLKSIVFFPDPIFLLCQNDDLQLFIWKFNKCGRKGNEVNVYEMNNQFDWIIYFDRLIYPKKRVTLACFVYELLRTSQGTLNVRGSAIFCFRNQNKWFVYLRAV